jgi:hypothetical protein
VVSDAAFRDDINSVVLAVICLDPSGFTHKSLTFAPRGSGKKKSRAHNFTTYD